MLNELISATNRAKKAARAGFKNTAKGEMARSRELYELLTDPSERRAARDAMANADEHVRLYLGISLTKGS